MLFRSPKAEEAFDTGLEYHWIERYDAAEPFFREAVRLCEVHLDAWHHLALICDRTERSEEAFELWIHAFDLGRATLPDEFRIGQDVLEYEVVENRPFLRVTHATGLAYMHRNEPWPASDVFEFLLAVCPGDNLVARRPLAACYFDIDYPDGVLDLCEEYGPDYYPHLWYARPLALFLQGKKKRARLALKRALRRSPRIGRMLLEEYPEVPDEWHAGRYPLGSDAEAFEYWYQWGPYWDLTEGALDFLEETVAEFDREHA